MAFNNFFSKKMPKSFARKKKVVPLQRQTKNDTQLASFWAMV